MYFYLLQTERSQRQFIDRYFIETVSTALAIVGNRCTMIAMLLFTMTLTNTD